jgi:DNA-binding LacI/PurR family transcriptional regulator
MSTEQARRLPPTLEEVAAAAGVSRSTVSRVVNGSTRVSAEVLANVTRAIDELHYVPNRMARSLANRQTMAIALVVPEETTRFFGDPYFASIVDGIARALRPSDYVLNLQFASPGTLSEKTVRYLMGGNVDGALVVSHHSGNHFLASLGHSLPVVFGGRPLHPDEQPSHYVDVDNVAAADMGTRYLTRAASASRRSPDRSTCPPASTGRPAGSARWTAPACAPTSSPAATSRWPAGRAACARCSTGLPGSTPCSSRAT